MSDSSLVLRSAPLARWSLTAKLTLATSALCVLCVGAISGVLSWRAAEQAHATAADAARLAARETAEQVGGELGRSFSAVTAVAGTMRGMRAADVAPSRDQLDAMARRTLEEHAEFVGTYSIGEPVGPWIGPALTLKPG